MKICYIWIESFKNFNNFSLNLSSSDKFKYDHGKNYLTHTKESSIPSNFFGKKIVDVLGIIGKNGVGKSNSLELICKILKGANDSLKKDFFLIIQEEGIYKGYYSFKELSKPNSNLDISFIIYKGSISQLKVVFFSNVFDGREPLFDKEIADISVNKTIKSNFYHRVGEEIASDFKKQISFITSKGFPKSKLDSPSHIIITSKLLMLPMPLQLKKLKGKDTDFTHFNRSYRQRIRKIIPENRLKHYLAYQFFLDHISNILLRNRSSNEINLNNSDLFITNLNSFLDTIINYKTEEIPIELINFIEKTFEGVENILYDNSSIYNNLDIDLSQKFKTSILNIRTLIEKIDLLDVEYNSEGRRSFDNYIVNFNIPIAKKLINIIASEFDDSSGININWFGISSGHKAYLNIFASLFYELKNTRTKNLLICIDEGDLYLHPKWQIEFFNKLIKILPLLFKGKIQLVLTSHSPFLLSDLPIQNITILDIDLQDQLFEVNYYKQNTFGGNLYDLYSGPFFLENSVIGDFAYNKIKELLKIIESSNSTKEEKEQQVKVANLIGDEVIKYKIDKILKNDNNSRTSE